MGGLRTPQQDRSRATRQRLLDAAIDSLVDVGWTHSTVAEVAERAGVSRGAAQHHFPTREALMTAAVEHVALRRDDAILADTARELAAMPPGSARTLRAVDVIVGWFIGPAFRAGLELWIAASAEPQLRELVLPLERQLGRHAHESALELLEADEEIPGIRELVQATLDLARGLGLAGLLSDDSVRRSRIVREWAFVLDQQLAAAGAEERG